MLSNTTSIVTGSSRGIGLATMKLFIENGSNVVACYNKNNEEIKKLKEIYPGKIFDYSFDFSDENQVKKIANEIISNHNNIDILVNNAGTINTSLFQMTPIKI